MSREHLAYLFWPDHAEEAARRNLRKTLFRLRALPWLTEVGPDHAHVEITTAGVRWMVATDVAEFRVAAMNRRARVVTGATGTHARVRDESVEVTVGQNPTKLLNMTFEFRAP